MPAARVGDTEVCNAPPDSVSQGEGTVIIQGQPAARQGDASSHGGALVAGCPTVLIGSSGQGQTLSVAARDGKPFCEECERKARARLEGEAPDDTPLDEEPVPEHRQLFHELQQAVDSKAAPVDRWLRRSPHRLASVYRRCLATRPGFAALIRGRMIDVLVRRWAEQRWGHRTNEQALLMDKRVPGSGRMRPDYYVADCEGERLLLDIGGATKRVDKYAGLSDRIYIIYTPPAK